MIDVPEFIQKAQESCPIENHSEVKKVEAIKIAYKQAREGNVVTFRLHFDDDTRAIADLPLGSRVLLAVVEIFE
jgi:hypothetical protein